LAKRQLLRSVFNIFGPIKTAFTEATFQHI